MLDNERWECPNCGGSKFYIMYLHPSGEPKKPLWNFPPCPGQWAGIGLQGYYISECKHCKAVVAW